MSTGTIDKKISDFTQSSVFLILCIALIPIITWWGWIGFIGSDDAIYAKGAYGWIDDFPFVGGHGTIRYPLTIPIALSFTVFGENEYAMVLPSYLYYLGSLALLWKLTSQFVNVAAANIALLLLITLPLLAIQSTITSVDIAEMFFLLLSFYLFVNALHSAKSTALLFWSGAAAGMAFITRETAIFIVPFFAILFLMGLRKSRKEYLMIALGFLSIWGLEILYLWIMTGDPLYRFNISINHDSTIDRQVDVAGNLIVHPLVDPLLVLLFNQEFMMLFWLAIPCAAWLNFTKSLDDNGKIFVRLLTLLGISWFVCVGAAMTLLPLNPRYFMISAFIAAILLAIAIQHSNLPKAMLATLLAICALNIAGIAVENKASLFGERKLAQIAAETGQIIYTDPMTRHRADILLRWGGNSDQVKNIPPAGKDMLFYYNPARSGDPAAFANKGEFEQFQPKDDWPMVASYEAPTDGFVYALEAIGLSSFVPQSVWSKLRNRHPDAKLYRTQ